MIKSSTHKQAPVVVFMAGGTGGHIFPALATAEALQQQGYRIHWLGTPDSMEADLVPKHGIDISFIPVTGLRGKGLSFLLKAPWKLASSLYKAVKVLRQQQPVCVVGMGGYVTGPGGVAAKLLGVPLVIHEQNAVAGLTNKLLSKIANRVLEAFPGTFADRSKVFLTGNPVRKTIAMIAPLESQRPVRLLVVGGSRGAVAINEIVPEVLNKCGRQISVWHQTGSNNQSECRAHYDRLGVTGRVDAFIDDMAEAYDWADLVLCRSGALTVAELAVAGRPAILVPFPHAVDDHQTVNGRYLVDQGAALMVQQKELSVEGLADMIQQFSDHPEKLDDMAAAARSVGLARATEEVARHCLEVSGQEVSHG
ncbi:undecaprenyldiphospho-muramoylpentapeptide beta-N-acetylglucosaminyltransferase [Endozoicomonas sp. (ex Bugula neritina AB1)]|nr:undecaprenyldiphospho-muramoylpentapeptide beta-N-acetylglucosaminyltransferase [Endozoicomonas sp. (ex Bugula neritina AB1)]